MVMEQQVGDLAPRGGTGIEVDSLPTSSPTPQQFVGNPVFMTGLGNNDSTTVDIEEIDNLTGPPHRNQHRPLRTTTNRPPPASVYMEPYGGEPYGSTQSVASPATAWGAPTWPVITEQPRLAGAATPGAASSRKQSKRQKGSVSDKITFFQADYVEIFTIGGGTKWIYAIVELFLQMFVLMKHYGVPMAGQIVDGYHTCMEAPYLGALFKVIMGAATRVSFSVAGGADSDHPPLQARLRPRCHAKAIPRL